MLIKTIKYNDFNDVEREERFYFNLTEAEVTELQLGTVGTLSEKLQKIIETHDQPTIIAYFKEFILLAYGEKSDDGKVFNKSKELSDAFSHTNAYSKLFMELATDSKKAAEFVNGCMPKKVQDAAKALEEENKVADANLSVVK